MRYLPINLDIRSRPVTVIGGGSVATRKCRALVDAGAAVTVVSPHLSSELALLCDRGVIRHVERGYERGDSAGAVLVIAATGDAAVNGTVAADAKAAGSLVDVVDTPEAGSFTMPAFFCRGDLVVTVSTAGKSPALSRQIRDEIATRYGREYGPVLLLLGAVRQKLLTHQSDSTYNKQILNQLLDHDLPALFRRGATTEIDDILSQLLGPEYTVGSLGLRDEDLP